MGCDCGDWYRNIRNAINGEDGSQSKNVVHSISEEGPIDETLYGKELQTKDGTRDGENKHGAIGSLRFCNWAAPEYGVVGEGGWTDFFQAAALAISIANAAAQQQIADMQQDLAESYYNMANGKWDRFYGNFVPLEKKLLNEVTTEPEAKMDCRKDRDRAASWVNGASAAMSAWLTGRARELRVCISHGDLRLPARRKALLLVDTDNYNYVDDRWFCDYSNDKRWNRRSSVLNLGRNLGSEALKYGDVARSLLNSVSGQIEQAAQGLVSAMGYYGARLDTYYPSTYLGQSQGNLANIGYGPGAGSQAAAGMGGQFGAT